MDVWLNLSSQERTTLTTHRRRRKRTTWCSQTVNTPTTGRRRRKSRHSPTTPPASPTLTFPTNSSWKTSTRASSALCSSASLVRNGPSPSAVAALRCPFCVGVFSNLPYLMSTEGSLDESGNQIGVHHEYVFLFGVFDENQSKYKQSSSMSDNMKYTINGYARGSLPGESIPLPSIIDLTPALIMNQTYVVLGYFLFFSDVSICAHSPVSLHLLGMSSQPEVFSVHINGQVFQQSGHKVSSVGLISGSSATVSMVALHTGRWLISSHTIKHVEGNDTRRPTSIVCPDFTLTQRVLTRTLLSPSWNARLRRREEVQWLRAASSALDLGAEAPKYRVDVLHRCRGNHLGLCT